jgi:hypothetical protein
LPGDVCILNIEQWLCSYNQELRLLTRFPDMTQSLLRLANEYACEHRVFQTSVKQFELDSTLLHATCLIRDEANPAKSTTIMNISTQKSNRIKRNQQLQSF